MTIYVFGEFSSGYTQYPNDIQHEVFQQIITEAKADTQVVIHRDDNLMYYCYLRKFSENKCIGFCVLLSGTYVEQVFSTFGIFEKQIENIAYRGNILHLDSEGNLTSSLRQLYEQPEEINLITDEITRLFQKLADKKNNLPPSDYSVASQSAVTFSLEDESDDVLYSSYTFGYTYILKEDDYNTEKMNAYRSTLKRHNKDKEELNSKCKDLLEALANERSRRRNLTWVGILSIVVIVMGTILYNKVLFPSEVTHYETGEFVYYGPLKNGKPNGVGVAIYPTDDYDGRKYYIGNFENGERQDSAAVLFYQDGDYYYGSMYGDNWQKGMLYMNSDNSHFVGSFQDNKPYTGKWYEHRISYRLIKGEKE